MAAINKNMNQSYLKTIFDYNPEDGLFRWKISPNRRIPVGTIVGSKDKDGYIYTKIDGKHYKLHRLVFVYMFDRMPSIFVDHINGQVNDNRLSNLRECDTFQNRHNSKLYSSNTSEIKGVSWQKDKKRWLARVRVNNKIVFLGYFTNKEDASIIVKKKREELHKDFTRHE